MTIDFTGSAPVHHQSLNANRSIVQSAILYCLRCLLKEEIPLNAGVLKPITLIIPEGMLNPPMQDDPHKCVAVVGGNVETSQRVVDVFFGALNIVAASQGTMNNLVFGNANFSYYETICGGSGAGPDFPGTSAIHCHMTNTRITDPEIIEQRYPVRVNQFAIRKGSGGDGKYPGGDGVIREFLYLDDVDVSLLTQRRTRPPYGLNGGDPGTPGKNILIRKNATEPETLPSLAQLKLHAGDILQIHTPGGGGAGVAE